jgi:hypothetical protein
MAAPKSLSARLRPYSLVLLGLGLVWHGSAAAFFCFSFGGGSRHRDLGPPPPPLMPPPVPAYAMPPPPFSPLQRTPTSEPPATQPELVEWPKASDGTLARTVYRFRPLTQKSEPPTVPATPAQSQPF